MALLTSSFPLDEEKPGGVFIEKLALQLTRRVKVTVLVPEARSGCDCARERGYELHCFRYAPRRWQLLAHNPGGIPVALKQNPLLYGIVPVFLVAMLATCVRTAKRVDLIHANWSVNGFVAGLSGLLCGIPVVTTLRGTDISSIRRSPVLQLFLSGCLLTSRHIVTVGSGMSNRLKEQFPQYSDKISTIPNGVDRSFMQLPLARENGNVCKLVSIGNLVPNKGMETILRAVGRLGDPEIRLRIVGDGAEKKSLLAVARELGIGTQIGFSGSVAHREIEDVYRHADIFVLASYSEGRPNVVVEAMASGLPVIASDIDGITELIEDDCTGLLFEPGNHVQLSDLIGQLRNDTERRHRLGSAAREFVRNNQLLWSQTADRYLQLYESALAGG